MGREWGGPETGRRTHHRAKNGQVPGLVRMGRVCNPPIELLSSEIGGHELGTED